MRSRPFLKSAILVVLVLFIGQAVLAQDIPQGDPFRGGQLYDNWFVTLDLMPPAGEHPLWQTQDTNSRSGTVTWRCSSCHGWDYKGADGAYGLGSQEYTGFPGINNIVGASTDEIIAWLDGSNNLDHTFVELINRRAMIDLIAFLRTKLVDVDLIIDSNDYTSLGIEVFGHEKYNQTCAKCHGIDGSTINFNTVKDSEFIGDVALSNPWKFVHKIRFGTTQNDSHAFEKQDWTLQDVADTLAYAQNLPPADPNAGVIDAANLDINYIGQGDMNAIVIAAGGILVVILFGLAWTSIKNNS